MNCPNCGKYAKKNQKFCTKCGTSLVVTDKTEHIVKNTGTFKNNNFIVVMIAVLILFIGVIGFCIVKNNATIQPDYKLETPVQVLSKIDELQARYFEIIERHDVLLQFEDDEVYQQDQKDLDLLFAEVEHNIDKNNPYLQKYHEIENKYANNPGMNTYDMNMFASEHYKAVDKLLNEVYQEVRKTIPKEDFKPLITSELRWLKEVENYNQVYEAMGFGSIGYLVKSGYEINMRSFRTLLLMLYL